MLENGVSTRQSSMPFGWANGRFPQVSGLCFTYNIEAAVGKPRHRCRAAGCVTGTCTGAAVDLTARVAVRDRRERLHGERRRRLPELLRPGTPPPGHHGSRCSPTTSTAKSPLNPVIQGRIKCFDPNPGSGHCLHDRFAVDALMRGRPSGRPRIDERSARRSWLARWLSLPRGCRCAGAHTPATAIGRAVEAFGSVSVSYEPGAAVSDVEAGGFPHIVDSNPEGRVHACVGRDRARRRPGCDRRGGRQGSRARRDARRPRGHEARGLEQRHRRRAPGRARA